MREGAVAGRLFNMDRRERGDEIVEEASCLDEPEESNLSFGLISLAMVLMPSFGDEDKAGEAICFLNKDLGSLLAIPIWSSKILHIEIVE